MIRARWRRAVGPALLVALLGLLLFPLLLGNSFWLRDMLLHAYPLKAYLRERLAAGELALWNPRLGLGRPFAGMVQPGVFYPLDVVLLLPFPRGVDAFFALHAFIAAFGMRAWLRGRGSDENGAVFGAALFALSGYFVSQLAGNGSYAVGAAWIPWALAAVADDAAPRGAAIARLGLAVALMILGGDPQAAWLAGALVAVEAATSAQRRHAFTVAGGGLALAVALAAVQLGPALEVARVGRPDGVPLHDALHFSFPPVRLIEFIAPGANADRIHRLYDEGTGLDYEPWSAGIYVGLATPLLAVAAVAAALARRRARHVAFAAVAVVALLVAFGRHAPFFAPFFRFVPGAKLFRYPEKYLLVTTLAVCALAAAGLPLVAARPRRAFVVGLAALAGLAIARQWTPLAIGAATLAPIAFVAAGRLRPRALPLALAAIVVADLLAQSVRLTDFIPSSLYRETPPPVAAARAIAGPGLIRLYRPQYLRFDAAEAAPAVVWRATLRPNIGVEDGVAPLDAYDNFEMPHEAALWAALKARPLRLLEVTSTRFALVPPSLFSSRDGFVERRAWPALQAILAEATHVPPRAYLAGVARVADDAGAAALLRAPDFTPGRTAILAPGDGAHDAHADGACTLEIDRPEHQRVRCHAGAPTYAIVADAWFPGWSATVDGAATPILRANLAMRAIAVPAGDSTVELRYRPRGLVAGAVVSLLALLFALGLTARAYRRPWPTAPGSPPSPPDRNTARNPASPNPQTPTTPAAPD